ncbi:iron ABC transporter permease [Microbacterium sp. VKM Ac-2923]|uniref:FecCD family ABC transporter permease n=1 Tax=Microbacterium sp. VKM Ac-2923 TaxID=2929476 RepID=UPI001FB22E8E|nr:iron chelate uptake ABC transporter family permease subunit [Microbacterium sp. VKM Ac-2923]MCJ1708505.1 iron chelate uptake ABC transporter family permease subunit [Microbacterium sp. VKM Ac-2923]
MTASAPPVATASDARRAPRLPRSLTARVMGLIVAITLLAVLLLLSVAVGSKDIALGTVVDALVHNTGNGDAYVVWDLRVPRTVVGLSIGVALGVAGALIQALTRNPLADPGILGVDAGAAFFVTLGIAVFGVTSVGGYVWFAFAGALVVTLVVYVIGSGGRGGADPLQLTLAGVALGAVLSGIVTAMVLIDPATFDQMRGWNAGSIVGRGWDILLPVAPFLLIGVVVALLATPSLNAIALGDDLATSLGANITRTRVLVVVAVTLLAGGSTAIAGPVGFVGLMVPHVARWFTGPDQRWILAYTLLLGPSLVLAADIIGRVIVRPGEIPVGIVTAFLGAPVLILLVRRRKVSGL